MVARIVVFLCLLGAVAAVNNTFVTPMNCSDDKASCNSYYMYTQGGTATDVANLYGVPPASVTNITGGQSFAVKLPCQCAYLPADYDSSNKSGALVYSSQINYTPSVQDLSYSSIVSKFENAVVIPDNLRAVNFTPGTPQVLYLGCGCLPTQYTAPPYEYKSVVTYRIKPGDILFALSSTFEDNRTAIKDLNHLPSEDVIVANRVLFIPIKSVDRINGTVPGPPGTAQPPARQKPKHVALGVGVAAAAIVAVSLFLLTAAVLCLRSNKACCSKHRQLNDRHGQTGTSTLSLTNEVEKGSILSGFAAFIGCGPLHRGGTAKNDNVKRNITLPKEANIVFDSEKPIVFMFDEIVTATENFDERQKLGQGAYGLVFYGNLRKQEVAIKQMKATKSREFYAELKVLCKVHHTNLVELIGYSAGRENLYLVYEYAENGALSDRLHDPGSKGFIPLSWNQRVQIAVDSARGLEYLHEHTKTHYVHRDVKTSNILLDGFFRAKVADFGLAKLVEQAGDGLGLTTRVVGTFGYLAPEYVRDGHASSKSDAYAFGVVLMELLTGCEAISKTKEGLKETNYEKRSLISLMLSVLSENDAYARLQDIVDPLLGDSYPKDGAYRLAMLSKACVEEDPAVRPDMRQVVLTLSQIMLASIEWEASLAGNSQVFSGLVQGR